MRLLTPSPQKRISTRQLSAAAENIAAAQFSMYGFDVLEQGSRARYFYDLAVANSGGMLKVTVCGSVRGFWKLVDDYLEAGCSAGSKQCHKAIDRWLERQAPRATFCLVQFDASDLTNMPRIYLATAAEIAARLHEGVDMLGDAALYEQFEGEDAAGQHTVASLPANWRFSQARVAELMNAPEDNAPLEFRFSESAACADCAAVQPASCVHCLPMMN